MNTTSHAAVGGTYVQLVESARQAPEKFVLTATPYRNEADAATFTAPVVTTTPCLICDAEIAHVGDVVSRICDNCADAAETSRCPCGAAIEGPGSYCSTSCVRRHGRKRTVARWADAGMEGADAMTDADIDADVDEDAAATLPPPARPSSNVLFAQHLNLVSANAHEHRHDVDASRMCCVCDAEATGVCKCGRKLCPGCGDDETGLCPHCDEVG